MIVHHVIMKVWMSQNIKCLLHCRLFTEQNKWVGDSSQFENSRYRHYFWKVFPKNSNALKVNLNFLVTVLFIGNLSSNSRGCGNIVNKWFIIVICAYIYIIIYNYIYTRTHARTHAHAHTHTHTHTHTKMHPVIRAYNSPNT